MRVRISAVRTPRIPASAGWAALGFAMIPIAYSLAMRVYRHGLKRGTRSKLQEPNAAMKPKNAEQAHEKPAADTANPPGREEVHASKVAEQKGTQTPPRKRTVKNKSVETIPDQPLNPKD